MKRDLAVAVAIDIGSGNKKAFRKLLRLILLEKFFNLILSMGESEISFNPSKDSTFGSIAACNNEVAFCPLEMVESFEIVQNSNGFPLHLGSASK